MGTLRVLGLFAVWLAAAEARYEIKSAPAYDAEKVNVHLIPHTHDDVGWLKTLDQYYYGANNTIQFANVRAILDSVSAELQKRPERRFTYVEVAFFARWFTELEDDEQEVVRKLVKEKRLSFANGGWCMHDEATTHYVAMVDQTTLGHRFLEAEFGIKPRVGWQIDPFGHSSTQASLMTYEAGFDALFFGRIDYQDREKRQREKRCEGLWQASPSLGEDNTVFWGLTGSYHGNYGAPEGFDFDVRNPDVIPLMDDPRLHEYNIPERVDAFVEKALSQAAQTQGKHIMMTLGMDFHYEAAANVYSNLDRLIHYVNADGRVNAFYSTPEDYMLAKNAELREDAGVEYGTKTDDFFPYSDCEDCMWTGYFTSRPNLKKYERDMSSYLLAARQLEVFAGVGAMVSSIEEPKKPLRRLAEASAVAQHHDAVTGTSKQHVAFDYALRLSDGYGEAAKLAAEAVRQMQGLPEQVPVLECPLLNASVCAATARLADVGFDVHVYNPLAQNRTAVVQVPVPTPSFAVFDGSSGEAVPLQVLRNLKMPPSSTPGRQLPFTVCFQASNVPALSFRKYAFKRLDFAEVDVAEPVPVDAGDEANGGGEASFSIANDKVAVRFDAITGRLASVSRKGGAAVSLDQGLYYYTGFDSGIINLDLGDCDPATGNDCPEEYTSAVLDHQQRMLSKSPIELHQGVKEHRGDLSRSTQNSGAYIFRPQQPDQRPIAVATKPKVYVVRGDLVSEVIQCWTPWLNQTIRVYDGDASIYFEWTVGPIPVSDGVGKEIISRFDSSIESDGTFYTDSNGREFIRRVRDYRPTWDLQVYQPVAGNYYPLNVAAYVQDSQATLSLLTDRSQGVGSLADGSLEVMIARRLLVDDSRGVGEPLNETESITPYGVECEACRIGEGIVSRGVHRVLLDPTEDSASSMRRAAEEMFSPLQLFFTPITTSGHVPSQRPSATLPQNIKLMTLEALAPGLVLIRLAHIFAASEGSNLAAEQVVNVADFVADLGFTIRQAREVSLTANQERSKLSHLSWRQEAQPRESARAKLEAGKVTLRPMEIWSAILNVVPIEPVEEAQS